MHRERSHEDQRWCPSASQEKHLQKQTKLNAVWLRLLVARITKCLGFVVVLVFQNKVSYITILAVLELSL